MPITHKTVEAFRPLRERARRQPPRLAIILGSGLGELAGRVRCLEQVPYAAVPGMNAPTIAGHMGQLILGTWAGRTVLIFSGRLHYYEGHPWQAVVQPAHIAHDLGASMLLTTNAAGGIRDDLVPGCLLSIHAHLDWTVPPLPRPPDHGEFARLYDARLTRIMQAAAQELGFVLPAGVYAQVTGPCYETPAEIRALQALGVDAVGMSTAREVQAGANLGLACAAISCITNRAAGLGPGRIHHDEVLACTSQTSDRIGDLVDCFLRRCGGTLPTCR